MSAKERLKATMAMMETGVPDVDPRDTKDERHAVNAVMNMIDGGADDADTYFLMGVLAHMKMTGSGNDAA